jgi:hypothetical protein
MSRKFSEARRAAFLRALAETGNQTLAAERAKVSRSWVQLQRSTDPAFRAAVEAAVAEAKVALSQRSASSAEHDGSSKPPRKWASQHGEELVVRGSRGRRVQVARARLHQWTPRVEARFLGLLAACCNLRLALREVGFTAASLHEHRRRWPDFDARCEEALDVGYRRLDDGVVTAGLVGLNPRLAEDFELSPPMVAPMSADDAIRLLRLHERRRWEAARGIGPGGRVWRWRRNREAAADPQDREEAWPEDSRPEDWREW